LNIQIPCVEVDAEPQYYIRSTDNAVMVRKTKHCYVNKVYENAGASFGVDENAGENSGEPIDESQPASNLEESVSGHASADAWLKRGFGNHRFKLDREDGEASLNRPRAADVKPGSAEPGDDRASWPSRQGPGPRCDAEAQEKLERLLERAEAELQAGQAAIAEWEKKGVRFAISRVVISLDLEKAANAPLNRARVVLPDDPKAKGTLARTRLDEMVAREQLTGSEYELALMFKANPCSRDVLGGFYNIVAGVVLHDKQASALADHRIGRSKGIAEVMRKLRLGLRLMVDHYLPEPKREVYGGPEWRTQMAKQLYSAQMHRASMIRRYWRSMPKPRTQMMVNGKGQKSN